MPPGRVALGGAAALGHGPHGKPPASGPGSCAVAGGVRAFIRLRPTDEETDIEMFDFPETRPNVITIKDPLSLGRREHSFEFSGIFKSEMNQVQVFQPVAGSIVDGALLGRSGCVMAYGQTGSGKTYSIFGDVGGEERGLLPRAIERLFQGFRQTDRSAAGGITVSFLEVYMDQVRDLGFPDGQYDPDDEGPGDEEDDVEHPGCNPSKSPSDTGFERSGRIVRANTSEVNVARADDKRPSLPARTNTAESGLNFTTPSGAVRPKRGLAVRETPDGMVHVQGLAQLKAHCEADVNEIVDRGLARRATAVTSVNVRSSRSHTVFSVHLPSMGMDDTSGGVYLSFVDLAGSERFSKSKAEGSRFREATAINSSLTALGKVVLALASDPRSVRHVPYRDSKLTRILSPSLGGGTQVSLIATIHPRVEDYEESLNTLSFADRCKNVARQPQVSVLSEKSDQKKRIFELQATVAQLKSDLRTVQNRAGGGQAGNSPEVRRIDTVDVAIAQALQAHGGAAALAAMAAGGSDARNSTSPGAAAGASRNESGSGAAGGLPPMPVSDRRVSGVHDPKSPAVNAEIMELMLVQEQRNRQAKLREKAETKAAELEKERFRQESAPDKRATELVKLEKRRAELEAELQSLQAEIRSMQEADAIALGRTHDTIRTTKLDDDTSKIHTALMQGRDVALRQQDELDERQRELDQKHDATMKQLKGQHASEVKEITTRLDASLEVMQARKRQLEQELAECHEEEDEKTRRCHEELSSLYDLALQLVSIIADAEDGLYPIVRHADGLKKAILPSGLVPAEPTLKSHPNMFSALAQAESMVEVLERRVQKPLPPAGKLHRLVAAANGLFDALDLDGGAAFNDVGIASNATAAVSSATDASNATTAVSSAPVTRQTDMQQQQHRTWCPGRAAQSIVQSESWSDAESQLLSLGTAQLKELCMALRPLAVEAFSTNDERAALQREAQRGLEDEGTLCYVRNLESKRDTIRAACSDAVEHVRRLRIDLELRRSTLFSSRTTTPGTSRPTSASTAHALSRARTPSVTGSRANSRPGTAGRSRPPTANSGRGVLR
eukprot:TRINITY_DN45868_c0_g1_i1.p1 TRINITY_DN45868_c0_g1~~TRINITY_DN45868_c0_g1_i1.p1  ORF type:complete len:1088 (-),score=199.40 TRINITY_DN45868_c0_g1_i1:58-3267(-)